MGTAQLTIRVECFVGHRGDKTPLRFFINGKAVEIEEVIDRWLAPDHRYFKVRSGENDIYILRYDELEQRWELTMFQSGRYKDSPSESVSQTKH